MWRVDGDDVSLLSIHDQTKLYSGDCYIVQYKYTYNERNEYLLYVWIGCESMEVRRLYSFLGFVSFQLFFTANHFVSCCSSMPISFQEDRADAISNASAIVSSTKGESVMVST